MPDILVHATRRIHNCIWISDSYYVSALIAALVECLSGEREVTGSIPGRNIPKS